LRQASPSPNDGVGARRRLAHVIVAVAVVALGLTAAAPSADAAPSTLTINGHGWGHGRGMGQFGAQGYATMAGWGAATILDHFYGGTAAGTIPANQQISVRLTALDGLDIAVTSNAPFTVGGYDQAAGRVVFFTIDSGGHFMVAGGTSCAGPTDGWVPATAPVVASSLAGDPGNDLNKMLTVCGGPTYRGSLQYLVGDGLKHTVNVVGVEDYLRGVVPRESPSWFAQSALQAQAVAARSYSMGEGGEFGTHYSYAKTCDSTTCQVYGGAGLNGTRLETTSTDFAVAATANSVRRFTADNSLARTEFSSSTGGWTAGGVFTPVPDDGDAVTSNPRHNWQTTLSTASIASRYGVGSFIGLNITQRNGLGDWGGRVLKLTVVGTAGSATILGSQFQSDWGLFSNWFTTDGQNGPGAVSPTPGRFDVVARGADNSPWWRTQTGSNASAWTPLGGVLISDPDISASSPSRLDVFGRGTDNALWHRATTNGGASWSPWESLGGILLSGPAATSSAPNRVDVFVTGTDFGVWTRSMIDGNWGPWSSLGGVVIGDPTVASPGGGRLDVFVRGTDNAVWHSWFTGSWQGWESWGGVLTSSPGAVAQPNRFDIFVRGTDSGAWGRAWTPAGLGPWYPLQGVLASRPDVAATGGGNLQLFVRGTDGAIYKISGDGTNWGSWTSFGVPG
jgi:SpoIID/LytB domain protein